jgi:hypothetical protein
MTFSGFFAATHTCFGDELTAGICEHESLAELSIFKVDGMAFGDVFLFGWFGLLRLDDEASVLALGAAFAFAGWAALSGKDALSGLLGKHGWVDKSAC